MKNIKLILAVLFLGVISCKAQQTTVMSQYEMEQCAKRLDKSVDCPGFENVVVTRVKDINNRLNAFEGTWTASYNGKQYELKLEKKVDFERYRKKWDKLLGKLRVKDSQGNIIFDSFSKPDLEASISGNNFQGSTYETRFWNDTNDCNDYGHLFIHTPKLNLNGSPTMTLFFYRDTGEIWDNFYATCPNYDTYQTIFPHKVDIIFTKQ